MEIYILDLVPCTKQVVPLSATERLREKVSNIPAHYRKSLGQRQLPLRPFFEDLFGDDIPMFLKLQAD